jgi:hypothetical protein
MVGLLWIAVNQSSTQQGLATRWKKSRPLYLYYLIHSNMNLNKMNIRQANIPTGNLCINSQDGIQISADRPSMPSKWHTERFPHHRTVAKNSKSRVVLQSAITKILNEKCRGQPGKK